MSAIKFQAELEEINGVALLRLPATASDQLPSRGLIMAKGKIGEIKIQTVLEPDGNKGHWLEVTQTMLAQTKIKIGEKVVVQIEASKEWIEPVVPEDLQTSLNSDKVAVQTWGEITPMARWEWIRWIRSTHNPETRKHRIEVAMSKLSKGNRRPCCFNSATCTVPEVAQNGKSGWVLKSA